ILVAVSTYCGTFYISSYGLFIIRLFRLHRSLGFNRGLPFRNVALIGGDQHRLGVAFPGHTEVEVRSDVAQLVVVVVIDVVARVMYLSAITIHRSSGLLRYLRRCRDGTHLTANGGISLVI